MVRFESVSLSYRALGARSAAPEVFRDVNFDLAGRLVPLAAGRLGVRQDHAAAADEHVAAADQRLGHRARLPHRFATPQHAAAAAPANWRHHSRIFRLLPHLSAYDNVALPLRLGRPAGTPGARRRHGDAALDGPAEKLVALPDDLSDGERQRVTIARAVISRPRLLLADEPTAGLDPAQSERVIHLLRELHRLGSTVIIATHNEAQVDRHPGPALMLSQGSLVEYG